MNDKKLILNEIKKHYNFKKDGDFADFLGIAPTTLSSWRSRNTMDYELLFAKCVDINAEYLLTGKGSILKTDNNSLVVKESETIYYSNSGTPIYDIDVTCGKEIRDFRDEDIIGYINIPSIRKDSKIVFATGDSMYPKVREGDRIVIREIESWDYFNYGQMYLVLTPEYRMLKYVRKHPTNKDIIILRSENCNYDDIELPKKEIVKLFIVENILSIKSL